MTLTGTLRLGNSAAGTVTITGDLTQGAKTIQIDSGGNVVFNSGNTLTTSGDVTVNAGGSIPGDNGATAHIVAAITNASRAARFMPISRPADRGS